MNSAMDKRLRVCLVAPTPPPYGGVATWTGMMLRYASSHDVGVDFSVVDTALRRRAIHQNNVLLRLIVGPLQFMRNYFVFLLLLVRMRPDVIHLTTWIKMGILRDIAVILTGWVFRINTVYHIRNSRAVQLSEKKTLEWRLFCIAAHYSVGLIVLNDQVLDVLKKRFPEKDIQKIPNGINVEELECLRQPKKVNPELTFVFAGLAVPIKGVGELIDAWRQIRPAGARLDVYGAFDDKYRRQLFDQYPGQLHHVDFHGETEHQLVMSALRDADVLVLPTSYPEGFPNVILEAMILETPVIATTVGAIPEMLADERGLLIPPRNVQALVDAMSSYVRDAELRKRHASNAKAYAMEHYHIDIVFQRYYQFWTQYTPTH
ncbi:MAG: glycosyltransferase family 4 protein [Planctomycetaceae bacterium]|nr:glycosyltransferase family 4 protein [Planctomycetaceae bacterium]